LVRRFFQPRQTLVIVGAAIVFLTFVIKDGLRENLKDEVAALENSHRQYEQRKQYTDILDAIQHRNQFRKITDEEALAGGWDDYLGIYKKREKWLAMSQYIDKDYTPDVQNADVLADALAENSQLAADRGKAHNALARLNETQERARKMFEEPTDKSRGKDPDMTEAERQIESDYEGIDAWAVPAIKNYAAEALDLAEKELQRTKLRYDRFTVASYFLFILGWVLGLTGRLMGSDGEEASTQE
jgi:hypothetical protein